MATSASIADWLEVLSQLDRHGARRQSSPDAAGLVELMNLYRVPGLSIAVEQDGERPWAAGYGTVAADAPTPVGPQTVFQACSISKHVAAFGALRLVDDGVLELDADINDYLTAWQLPASEGWRASVTLRQVLAHTAGLSYNWFRGFGAGEPAPTMRQVLQGQAPANTPPVRASLLPGSRFRYSGSHYAVLQQLVTDVTGERFEDLMRVLVLDPVGMADSSFDQAFPAERPHLAAAGHHTDGTPVRGQWRTIPEMAGAGLWTTPSDLVRLEREIARAVTGGSALLSGDLAQQMLTPQIPGGYGLGTEVDDSNGRLRFGHTGSNIGYNCFSFAWADTGAAVAVMANMDNAGEILGSILAASERLYGTPTDPPRPPTPDRATGRYLLRDDYLIEIGSVDGRLTITAPGQPTVALLPLAGDRYRVPGLDCEIRFPCAAEHVSAMEIRQEDVTETATRQR